MGERLARIGRFFGELKRRRVIRVAVAYLIAGWFTIQVSATTFPFLDLPDWMVTAIIALVVMGLPLAFGLSWAYDLTPDGVQRAAPFSDSPTPPGPADTATEPAPSTNPGAASDTGSLDDGRVRLAVLPFRMLRPDPETDFLAFSLPDAVTSSLAEIQSVIVRSQLAALARRAARPHALRGAP